MRAECIDILTELETWYAREGGQYLLESTREAMQEVLATSFGYHILQVGMGGNKPLCADSPINHRIFCAERPGEGVDLLAHPDELPLENDSVDTIIVHNCLEFSLHPHQVLREIQRVLIPQGQLLVVGFNPHSLLGLGMRVRGAIGHPVWQNYRPVSVNRLSDWLRLLGCEVQDTFHLQCLPPVGSGRWRQWMIQCDHWTRQFNLPWGGIYVLHAVKNVAGLHRPRRLRPSRSGRLVGLVPKATPSPTPKTTAPLHCRPFGKGDVAA